MNLLLLEAEEISPEGLVLLAGRRAEHLRKVLKVAAGKVLRAGVLGGGLGSAEVLECTVTELRLRVVVGPASPVEPWADLILALPRPAVLHRLLQAAAAFGLSHVHLVRSWRVEKSYFASPALRPEAIRKHLVLGAEQGMLTRLPKVSIHQRLMPFLDGLASVPSTGFRILAHPKTGRHLESIYRAPTSPRALAPVWLAIGPAGGWIDREVDSFQRVGFEALGLSPSILRVETAVAVALGQLQMLRRQAAQDSQGCHTC